MRELWKRLEIILLFSEDLFMFSTLLHMQSVSTFTKRMLKSYYYSEHRHVYVLNFTLDNISHLRGYNHHVHLLVLLLLHCGVEGKGDIKNVFSDLIMQSFIHKEA